MLRNITWLGATSIAVKPIWFLFITVLTAEVLGADGYGVMTVALSLAMIATGFTDVGMGAYSVREVARDRSSASLFFTNFLLARILLVVAAMTAALVAGLLLGYRGPVLWAVIFAGLYTMSLSVITYARSFFQAFEVLRYEAISLLAEKVLVVGLGLTLLYATRSAAGTLLGMAVGMTVVTGLTILWIHHRLAPLRPSAFSPAFVKTSLRRLLPFALIALLSVIYIRTNLILVEQLLGTTEAGQYGLAFRILEALNLIPMIIATSAIYPRLSALQHRGDLPGVRRIFRTGALALAGIGIAAAAAIAWAAPAAVEFVIRVRSLDPAFAATVPALQVIVWSFPFAGLNALFQAGLIAMDHQRFLVVALAAGTLLNVALNLLTIPAWGIVGASAATLGSEVVLFVLYGIRQNRALALARRVDPPGQVRPA